MVVDTYHVWWDPELARSIARAGAQGRIAAYQICDWLVPMAADPLLSRGMMGDGLIDFASIAHWSHAAGYAATSRSRSSTRRSGPLTGTRSSRP